MTNTDVGFFTYHDDTPRRQFFVGPQLKIFDTVPYVGLHCGSVELYGSTFFTSYFTAGYLNKVARGQKIEVLGNDIKEYHHNLYFEFGIHAEDVPVIDALRIKGGILVPSPWGNKPKAEVDQIKTRIVIEVPLQGVHRF